MLNRQSFLLLGVLAIGLSASAQSNLTTSPEKPKAGEVVTFSYVPSGDIANTLAPVTAVAYQLGSKSQKAMDIALTKKDGKYWGTVQTDTSGTFLYFSFTSNKKMDNNFNNGYTLNLYQDDKVKNGSMLAEALFYQFYASNTGTDRNNTRALEYYDKEFALYPENRKRNLPGYLRLYSAEKKDDATAKAQKEIEGLLKAGLKDESDYTLLEGLYTVARLPQQAKLINSVKKEKFPNGKWMINDFLNEQDPTKKQAMLETIAGKIASDPDWKANQSDLPVLKLQMANAYAEAKNWDAFKKAVADANVTDKAQVASLYNNVAWGIQESNTNLPLAEELSQYAVDNAKAEWQKPTIPKPDFLTNAQWEDNRKGTYAMYADTYGMILYKKGDYKKGLAYSKDAALVIGEGKQADENNTYALLAEKALPQKEYKKQLEEFVKNGNSTAQIKEILKRAYVKDKKSDAGFDDYIAALEKDSYLKMIDELHKSMINEAAPSFALYNLDGNKIDIADLKGKIVVLDFWATWCGPCKASFPGMQKMLNKYKDDPNVKFAFVDTWERTEDKKKGAQDFVKANKYSFDVLMDTEDKVVSQFKVDGIPTKFVIDKEGKIRFKAVGFDGSDDKLVEELTAMIDMAGNPDKKAF